MIGFVLATGAGVGNTLVILIAFIVLMVVLYRVAWQPINRTLNERQETIDAALDQAAAKEQEAIHHEELAKAAIQQAHEEAREIVSAAKLAAAQLQETSLQQAQQQAVTVLQDAEKEVQQAKAQMMQSVKQQLGTMAVSLAQQVIKREIKPEEHQQLIEAFIKELAE